MSVRVIIKQNDDSRFLIVHRDTETNIEQFFGGFRNETEFPGTEDESFAWEMESWVDRPEDGAVMFSSLRDAKDCLGVIDESKRENCSIILYGKGEVENFMLGSYWYPLKVFVGGNEND